ncbi:MAG TPA: pitrilysin family protein [Chiayiivirga sp.]|nr:pitrilysin family protein [Chiayiivirga sp.]
MRLPTLLAVSFALLLLSIGPSRALSLPPSQEFTLDNGLTVLLTPKHDVPLVAASVVVRGGALVDPPGKEGSMQLLAELLGKGAGERDARAFVNAVADVGGELSFSASTEALHGQASFLADDAALMLELLSDALQRPALAQGEFDKLRERAIQSLAALKDGDPRALLDVYGNAWLFRDHPYGRPVHGSEASLAALTLDDLRALHRSRIGADRAILSLAGDFEPEAMRRAVTAAFGSWHKAEGEPPEVPTAVRPQGPRVLLVDKPGATQSYFWIGTLGAAAHDPASAGQDLVQTLFGGRFTSMLNAELRVKSGLTYGARAELERLSRPGAAAWYSFTRTDATERAIDLGLEVQERLHHQTVKEDDLQSARRYVIGQFAPEYETHGQIADALAMLALYGQPRERIERYTEEIAAVGPAAFAAARAVFPQGRDYAMVVIGDGEKIASTLSKYGPVTRMRITDPAFSPPPADGNRPTR